MKQLVLVLILSLLIIGSTTFALAQGQNKDKNLTTNWNSSESQKLSYFLELPTDQHNEAGELIVERKLTGKGYSDISSANDFAMHQQLDGPNVQVNFEILDLSRSLLSICLKSVKQKYSAENTNQI